MTMTINIKLDKPIGLFVEDLAEKMKPAEARGVLRGAEHAGGVIGIVVVEEFPGGSGQLAGSFLPAAFVESTEGVAAGALSDLPHAGVLNTGEPDPIVSSRGAGKMLAQPLSVEAKTKWPREWPEGALTLIESKKGNVILAGIEGTGKDAKITPHYLLRESVSIRGRHYIDTAARRATVRVHEIMNEELQEAADEAEREFNG